ncbi:Amino-terminal intein-mediated trans-splice / DNA polymerase III alpha subunit [Crocosphaera watsonii WH 0402]|nr:Amino-terminal intein-mediated trans-splice / DNA polymerase III alpha subunit [Crocosphaera watsonii WH 0402]
MVNEVKQYTTKKGDPMAFLVLEDGSAQVEGVCFPETYKKVREVLTEDSRLIVWGKVDHREDKIQLIVNDAEPVETVRMVMVKLSVEQARNRDYYSSLKRILRDNAGDKNKSKIPVIAIIGSGENRQLIRLGEDYWVHNDKSVVEALRNAKFDAFPTPLVSNS